MVALCDTTGHILREIRVTLILRRAGLIIGLLGAVGCRADTTARQGRYAAVVFSHADSAYYLDPREHCELLQQPVNPDPVALVAEYIRRDQEGQFLGTHPWLDSAYDCPGHLPAPDSFTAVKESRIVSSIRTDSLARILVQSTVLGDIGQDSIGSVFVQRTAISVDTFVVARIRTQWLEEHQVKLGQLHETLSDVSDRFEKLGPEIEERVESPEYLSLVRQAFRAWDKEVVGRFETGA